MEITMEFTFDFTAEKLAKCIKKNKNPDEWYEGLAEQLPKFAIVTPARVAGFISQCQHESLDFTILTENLNYSAKGLMGIFKKYFPNEAIAKQYERKPEKIANRVYGGRMGNGDEASGDGWTFRGRGLVQLTGRANYTQCSRDLFGDDTLIENPDLVTEPDYAVLSACWFWHKNRLNDICDRGDVVLLSKRINGGTIGLADRIHHWNLCLELFEN
jgi:putative chitinase